MPQNRANYRKNRRIKKMIKRYEGLVLKWEEKKLDEPSTKGEYGQSDLTPYNTDMLIRGRISIEEIKYKISSKY